MEKIKFITDSSSDLSKKLQEEFNIEVTPMGIMMNGEYYNEGVDFTKEEFYTIMETQKKIEIPTSSAINPQTWYDIFEKHALAKEFDRLVVIPVGCALSSSNPSAWSARESIYKAYPNLEDVMKIDIIDSGSASAGYGYPITQAITKLNNGIAYKEVREYLDDWFNSLEVYFVAFSFDVAKKSGRINGAAAYIGELLNLRPIMVNIDGVFSVVTKVRGNSQVAPKILEIAKKRMRKGSEYIFLNGTQPNVCDDIHNLFKNEFGYAASANFKPGPAMVINAGTDMLCVGFLCENRKKKI